MISPLDTHIAFFGGAANPAAVEAVTRLAEAGFDVVAASHNPRETVALREAGIPFIGERIDAIEDCQVVITSLATSDEAEELYLGESGLLELAETGTCFMDVSFIKPQLAREIHALAAVSDIEYVDAPITSLGEGEQSAMFVGGTAEVRESLSPLFPYMAATVHPQEGPGDGMFAAMMAYIALAGSLMGVIEALSLARTAGFSEKAALNVLASTAGGSRALVGYAPRILAHDFSGNLKLSQFADALDAALDAAESLEVTVPMMETAYQLCDLLSVVGGDDMNVHALSLLYEDEKTCAEHGLDWALAENSSHHPDDDDADGSYGDDEYYRQDFDLSDGLDLGFGGHGPSFGHGGHSHGHGGYPPIGGFFSRN